MGHTSSRPLRDVVSSEYHVGVAPEHGIAHLSSTWLHAVFWQIINFLKISLTITLLNPQPN